MIKRIALALKRWRASRRWVVVATALPSFVFEQRMDGERRIIVEGWKVYPNPVNLIWPCKAHKWLHGGSLPSYAKPISEDTNELR